MSLPVLDRRWVSMSQSVCISSADAMSAKR